MEIIASNKGGQKLLHEGFIYTVQHERPSGKRWQCVQRNEECKGTVKTTGIAGDPVVVGRHLVDFCRHLCMIHEHSIFLLSYLSSQSRINLKCNYSIQFSSSGVHSSSTLFITTSIKIAIKS